MNTKEEREETRKAMAFDALDTFRAQLTGLHSAIATLRWETAAERVEEARRGLEVLREIVRSQAADAVLSGDSEVKDGPQVS